MSEARKKGAQPPKVAKRRVRVRERADKIMEGKCGHGLISRQATAVADAADELLQEANDRIRTLERRLEELEGKMLGIESRGRPIR